MDRSMIIGGIVGAGAVGWYVYRNKEREKCFMAVIANNKVQVAHTFAQTAGAALPAEFGWLSTQQGIKARVHALIKYDNRTTAEQAYTKILNSLPKVPKTANEATDTVVDLIDLLQDQTGINLPDSVERELATAGGQAAQTPGGQAAQSVWQASDTIWNFVQQPQQSHKNPALGWDEFLAGLR